MNEVDGPCETVGLSAPLVTAVLVCWNHERFVRQSVLSALQQTYPNLQVIVFDNGSTDGSRRELQALARERDFTLVCQDNIGLVRTLNKALSFAEGKYFTPLATDDAWLPEKIARQVRFMEANEDVHMVCGRICAIDENGRAFTRHSDFAPGEVTFQKLVRSEMRVYGPTVMCRTETMKRLGGYDEKIPIEDFAMALRFAQHGHRVMALDEVFTLYRRHSGNWTNRTVWPEALEVGRAYLGAADYVTYVRAHARGYFRWLAGTNKRDAIRVLRSEPIAWTWDDVGVGMLKLLVPPLLLKCRRRLKNI